MRTHNARHYTRTGTHLVALQCMLQHFKTQSINKLYLQLLNSMKIFLTRYPHLGSHCRHQHDEVGAKYLTKILVISEIIFSYCARNQDVIFVALNNGKIRAHLPASSKGVFPSRFLAVLSAPLNSRYNTHVIEPKAYAKCKAVLPSRSEDRISAS